MIEYKRGNIFLSDADALVNTVNCEGHMGKGLAFQFKKNYPEMEKDYKRICELGELKPGKLHFFEENNKLIINFPTKNKWRAKSKIEYIEEGLIALKDELIQRNIKSIAIPPLGSGNGGLTWNEVKQSIENQLNEISAKVKIEVYEPAASVEETTLEPKTNLKTLYLLYISEKLNDFKFSNLKKSVELLKVLSKNELDIPNLKQEVNEIRKLKKYYNTEDNNELYSLVKNKIISESIQNMERKFEPLINKIANIINNHDEETVQYFIVTFNLVTMKKGEKLKEEIPENIISLLFTEGLLKQDIFENIEINYIK